MIGKFNNHKTQLPVIHMQANKAKLLNAWPYMQDKMNLPVENLEKSLPFYQRILGFNLVSTNHDTKSAVLMRDHIEIGLCENGGDPSQDGCFFETDDVESTWEEFKNNGLEKATPEFSEQVHGSTRWKVFFIVAPDGLCYCIGQKQ